MSFEPQAATAAWMNTLSAEELELARAYTTGNHWLILAGLIVSAIVTWLIVRSGVLDWAFSKISDRWQNLRVFAVALLFGVVSNLIALPYSIYTQWYRESAFGRTSQPLGDFLSQGALGMLVSSVLLSLLFVGVYALIRKSGKLWWLWSGLFVGAFAALALLTLSPVIERMFNTYEPIPEGEVRDAVHALGAEAGIPADRIFMYDGSRQSNNFTANVSGIGGAARIAISDVAMDEASLDEVKAVTGHEIGHYVLGHVWRSVAVIAVLALLGFFFTDRTYSWFARRFGGTAELSDVRGIAVLTFVLGLIFTLAQPVLNTFTRMGEREADAYSLRTVNLPDALSGALIKTAEYRYPLAGDLEEALFYTHPTVENRVSSAMEWKAKNLGSSEGE
ncbi:M48 family metalloprotease [Qipengyuania nanhaisediminis]|uniref:M48 family metalloprotease n=1 Tax=Qipengyuania nanhaisediminis TaxID=604088 RepID=UPI0038B2F6E2